MAETLTGPGIGACGVVSAMAQNGIHPSAIVRQDMCIFARREDLRARKIP